MKLKHLAVDGLAMASTRSFGAEALAFVRYVVIASVVFLLQGLIAELLSNNIHMSSSLEDKAGGAIIFIIVTIIFATYYSVLPFVVMVVLARRFKIKSVAYYGVAGCFMAAFTSFSISWWPPFGSPIGVAFTSWRKVVENIAFMLSPVVTATLAYWWYDVRKAVSTE